VDLSGNSLIVKKA